jgi:raffinose/stachyose/melibiose transport system permease protein
MKRSAGEVGLNYLVLIAFSMVAIIPLVGVVLSAVTPTDDPQGGFRIPSAIHLGNFVEAWSRGHFSSYMLSSVFVTVCVVALTVILATLAGFAFARMEFPGRNALFICCCPVCCCRPRPSSSRCTTTCVPSD